MDFCSYGRTLYSFIYLFDRLYRKFKLTRMRVFFFFFFFFLKVNINKSKTELVRFFFQS